MNNELISIIVPIYNTEKYLHECLDSIQQQTYPHFECIMVNDGSTDSSARIAEEYLSDSRFRLINQNNQGLSSARNTGIRCIKDSSSLYRLLIVMIISIYILGKVNSTYRRRCRCDRRIDRNVLRWG